MEKKKFISKLDFLDNNLVSNIYDKIILAKKISNVIYTGEFYPPNVWKTLEDLSDEIEIGVHSYGIFEDAERKLIAFSDDSVWNYPIKLIKIEGMSKFGRLEHKDYLGALMALGIKRQKFGDLILKDNECYIAVHEEIVDYVKMNLTNIGRSSCAIDILDEYNFKIPSYDFETIIVNVSSLRVDCIISALCNISRNKADDLIVHNKVLVDYCENFKKNKILSYDSIITIRGYGKFKILEEVGWTKTGKVKVIIKKFI